MQPQFDSASREMQILNFEIPELKLGFKKITPFAENKFGKQRLTLLVDDASQKVLDDVHAKVLNMDVTVYQGLQPTVVKFRDLIAAPNEMPKQLHRNGFIDVGPATGRAKMAVARDGVWRDATMETVNEELNRLTPHNVGVRVSIWSRHDGEKYVFGYFTQLAALVY